MNNDDQYFEDRIYDKTTEFLLTAANLKSEDWPLYKIMFKLPFVKSKFSELEKMLDKEIPTIKKQLESEDDNTYNFCNSTILKHTNLSISEVLDKASEFLKLHNKIFKGKIRLDDVVKKEYSDAANFLITLVDVGYSAYKGAKNTIKLTNLIVDLDELVSKDKLSIEQSNVLRKVYDYYTFAKLVGVRYIDTKLYSSIRTECKDMYSTVARSNIESTEYIVKKYLDDKFLK
jgi:hypothetical protein